MEESTISTSDAIFYFPCNYSPVVNICSDKLKVEKTLFYSFYSNQKDEEPLYIQNFKDSSFIINENDTILYYDINNQLILSKQMNIIMKREMDNTEIKISVDEKRFDLNTPNTKSKTMTRAIEYTLLFTIKKLSDKTLLYLVVNFPGVIIKNPLNSKVKSSFHDIICSETKSLIYFGNNNYVVSSIVPTRKEIIFSQTTNLKNKKHIPHNEHLLDISVSDGSYNINKKGLIIYEKWKNPERVSVFEILDYQESNNKFLDSFFIKKLNQEEKSKPEYQVKVSTKYISEGETLLYIHFTFKNYISPTLFIMIQKMAFNYIETMRKCSIEQI